MGLHFYQLKIQIRMVLGFRHILNISQMCVYRFEFTAFSRVFLLTTLYQLIRYLKVYHLAYGLQKQILHVLEASQNFLIGLYLHLVMHYYSSQNAKANNQNTVKW